MDLAATDPGVPLNHKMNSNLQTHTPETPQPKPSLNLLRTSNSDALGVQISKDWVNRMDTLYDKLVTLYNPTSKEVVTKRSIESTRYHPAGQRKLKERIHKRLGTYPAEGGILLTLTIAGLDTGQASYEGMSQQEAWQGIGYAARYFMDRVNKSRKARGLSKVKRYISVIEDQPQRHYPHKHFWFPGLKWLGNIEEIQKLWPWGNVDLDYIDSSSPASYIIKYISKMEGKDFMQAMIWHYRLRLFSTSRNFRYIYKDETDSGWRFWCTGGHFSTQEKIDVLIDEGYSVVDTTLISPRGG